MSANRIAVLTLVGLLTTAWTLAAENAQESRTGSLLAAIEKSCRAREISPGHGHKVLPVAQASLKIKDRIPEIKGADPMLSQVAALLHDIGGGGLPGETKGPPIAKEILEEQKCDPAMIERVCRIIATHHHLKGDLDIVAGERPEWLLVIIADRPDVIRQYEAAPHDTASLERDVNAWIVRLNRDIRWKAEPPANTAVVPVPKLENDSYDWYARHEAVLRIKDRINPEIVMIGDSITHFWGGPPEAHIQRGPQAWKGLFGERRVLNLGFGWDRTQNVLWRLDHGEFDGLHPRYVVINIGTNNFSATSHARANTPAEVAEGIRAICACISAKSPATRIIVMGVLPRGAKADDPFRSKILELNKKLLAEFGKARGVTFLDIGSRFLLPNGELPRKLMSDFCHPTEEGYAIWASALKPLLQGDGSSAAAGTPTPQRLLLWPGQAPVGDGKSEAANTTITVHLPPPSPSKSK